MVQKSNSAFVALGDSEAASLPYPRVLLRSDRAECRSKWVETRTNKGRIRAGGDGCEKVTSRTGPRGGVRVRVFEEIQKQKRRKMKRNRRDGSAQQRSGLARWRRLYSARLREPCLHGGPFTFLCFKSGRPGADQTGARRRLISEISPMSRDGRGGTGGGRSSNSAWCSTARLLEWPVATMGQQPWRLSFQKRCSCLVHVSPGSCVCVEMIRVVPTVRLADVHFNEVSGSPEITQPMSSP